MAAAATLFTTFNDYLGKRIQLSRKKVHIENFAFRLSTSVTVGILFVCAGLVTLQSLVGEHIKCIKPPKEDVREEAMNQYCFIMSTYTLPHLYNQSYPEVPHFGVGPHILEEHEQKYHMYYQWVPFVLYFLALLFYVPHVLWKAREDRLIKTYCEYKIFDKTTFRQRAILSAKDSKEADKAVKVLADSFHHSMEVNNHALYAGTYIICEILNFIIVVVTIFLVDSFLGGEFSTYGPEVISFIYQDPEDRIDPMNRVFPKVAKCDFHKFGPSGNLIRYDIMCVLALNIINEKIFVFLWFWFVILAIVSGLNLLYRLVVALVPAVRKKMLVRRVTPKQRAAVAFLFDKLLYPDWFVLKRVSENSTHADFTWFCVKLNEILNPTYARRLSSVPSLNSGSTKVPSVTSPPPHYSDSYKIDETLPMKSANASEGNVYASGPDSVSPFNRNTSSDEPLVRYRPDTPRYGADSESRESRRDSLNSL